MQPDHTPANRLISITFHDGVVGFKDGITIKRVDIELPHDAPLYKTVRAICIGADNSVIDVSEAGSIIDVAAYLGREFAISRQYLMDRYEYRMAFDTRMKAAESFRLEEEAKSGPMTQFIADNVVYIIVRQGAYIIVHPNEEDRKFNALYTVYAQHEGQDPDTALILEESYDTLFQAVTCIRNLIEKDLFQAFMPEACK